MGRKPRLSGGQTHCQNCRSSPPCSMLGIGLHGCRDDSRFAPSQWETALLCNDVSHWLGASLESSLWVQWEGFGTVYSIDYAHDSVWLPGGGGGVTPYMMGDTYVPRFWPRFLTLWVPNSIFLGCFVSSTNTKTIFWVQILTKFDLFGPKIPFSPWSFWVQFSVAHGTHPAIFGPSTPPPPWVRLCFVWAIL